MFDKFNEQARLVFTLAQEEAQHLNHNYIGTEHLLLGLAREEEAEAPSTRMLDYLGVRPEEARSAVLFIIGQGDRVVMGQIGMTPRAKKVVELSVDEARRMNHHYVGTEHLLLGLVREREGIAGGVLKDMGVTLERARDAFTRVVMSGAGSAGGRSQGGPYTPSAPATPATGPKNNVVTCRLDDAAVNALDALVEAGIRSTRSDAAAWLISAGIEAHRELFDRVNTTVSEIRKLRQEAQHIARQVTNGETEQTLPEGDDTGSGDDASTGDVKDPEEPEDLDDLGRLDEPPTA